MQVMRSGVAARSFLPKAANCVSLHSYAPQCDRCAKPRRGRCAPVRNGVVNAEGSVEVQGDAEEDRLSVAFLPSWLEEWSEIPSRMTSFGLSAAALGPALGLGQRRPRIRGLAGGVFEGSGLDATDPLSIAKALGILTVVVAVHECGHFLAARVQSIHVSKFAIGFGPSLVRYQGRVVEYSIRALPLGGFVAFPDDDPDSPYPEDDPDLLKNRPIPDRALVISAGVIANVLFAFAILFAQASTVGITNEVLEPGVIIPKVLRSSAADRAGIEAGDVILAVDGRETAPEPSTVGSIVAAIESHPNQDLVFSLERADRQLTIKAAPSKDAKGIGRLGIQLVAKRHFSTRVAKNLSQSAQLASEEFLRLNGEILNGLKQLVFNFSQSAEQVSGPIAIVAMGAEVAKLNEPQLYLFAAIVNLNLAIVNTLPLPALDGGYFALLLLEALRGGKKLPPGIEQGVMASGILFLMAVGCVLVVRDITAL